MDEWHVKALCAAEAFREAERLLACEVSHNFEERIIALTQSTNIL
jgi:hypothetical protein